MGIVERIHEFATDLAVGYDENYWSSDLTLNTSSKLQTTQNPENFNIFLQSKWVVKLPSTQSVVSMGYLRKVKEERDIYTLTEKGIRLADAPAIPPNVFISYKHCESSAFALLLEARIKYETHAKPYIDKNPDLGQNLDITLEEKVKSCEAFICVIAKTTFDSKSVCDEIGWAKANNTRIIIPVCHKEYDINRVNEIFDKKFAVRVKEESAEEYDRAVHKVLNLLGYSTHFIAQRQSV